MPPSSNTTLGKGTTLSLGTTTNGTTTYAAVAKIAKLDLGSQRGEVEDVVLESDFTDYLPTIGEAEANFTIRFRPGDAGYQKVALAYKNGTTDPYRVTYPDGSTSDFPAFLKGFKKSFENKSIIDVEVAMRIRADPVFTPAP